MTCLRPGTSTFETQTRMGSGVAHRQSPWLTIRALVVHAGLSLLPPCATVRLDWISYKKRTVVEYMGKAIALV
ncbi:hypothetical protein V6N11_030851 [Hibiscus sabdariffa]|uniref:Uncharacterized protein n=1 Tax=Hibiscus sabdariffa TaxID=183260 RepID=A0ABR2AHX2_9ROSI